MQRLLGPLCAAVICWQAVSPAGAPDTHDLPAPTVVRWSHGDPPKKLIPAAAGFCYVSGIGGNFEGGGEAVRVFVDDGWWWVAGRSCQPSLWIDVTCLRLPGQQAGVLWGGLPASVR